MFFHLVWLSLYILPCWCLNIVVLGSFYYLQKKPFVAIHFYTVWNCSFHSLENCPRQIIHHTKAVVWVWFCHKICCVFNSLCPTWMFHISVGNTSCSSYLLNYLKCTDRNENLHMETPTKNCFTSKFCHIFFLFLGGVQVQLIWSFKTKN